MAIHNPAAEPRRSIYYDYRVFPFHRPPELDGHAVRHGVALVGAGPVGLAVALDLARYGVPCVLLESERQVSEGSRAIVFTRRSMEILQQVGVAGRMTVHGLPWRYGNSFYRGQRVFRLQAPHDDDDRFQPMLNLQQQYLEEYLVERALAEPLFDLRWASRVAEVLGNDADGVRLRVETPAGDYVLHADWLVAADGARSTVRQALGLKMEGDAWEGRFVIADIRIDLPFPTERLAFFDPPWNPGNTVLMHREPHGIWRIDYRLPDGESPEAALRPEALAARINAHLAMIGYADRPWALDWCSVYSARAMTLPDYIVGRVIFCGDAAHMLPIFGVRGANTGWQDGHDLAWKLAFVHRGLAGPGLLASYSAERVTAAREIIAEASRSTRFMTPPTRGFRLLRDATLSLSLSQDFIRPLFHWRTSRAHDYFGSVLNAPGDDNAVDGGLKDGAPIRNVRLGEDDFLFDHLGASFHLFHFTAGGDIPADVQALREGLRAKGVPFAIIAVRADDQAAAGADLTFRDGEGRFAARFGTAGGVSTWLVRPDQHVCGRWQALSAAAVEAAVEHILNA